MMRRGRPPGPGADRRTNTATVLGLTGLAAAVVLLVRFWMSDRTHIDPTSAMALGLALVTALVGLVRWARGRRATASTPATAEQLTQAAASLAGQVRAQWRREATMRSLGDPGPMPVRWGATSRYLMDHPHAIADPGTTGGFTTRTSDINQLTAQFLALPQRRLVIVGGGGTGKTTLAIQLLLTLLPPPGQSVTEPVPVLLSVSDWDPTQEPTLQEWLGRQLRHTYPSLAAVADDVPDALADQGWVLPILDGLDEVEPARAAAILIALNKSLPEGGGLILTSRRTEYQAAITTAEDRFTAALVIAPVPLTPTDAADYLATALPPDLPPPHPPPRWTRPWPKLLSELADGGLPALAALVATPLGLWLLRAVYLDTHRDPTPLLNGTYTTHEHLQAHLLDELIPALITARPPQPRRRRAAPEDPLRPQHHHNPEDLRRWLTTIASHLRATNTRDWRWWYLPAYTRPLTRSAKLATKLTGVLPLVLFFGLVFGLLGGPRAGLVGGLVGSLVSGLFFGLFFGLVSRLVSMMSRLEGKQDIVVSPELTERPPLHAIPLHAAPRLAGRGAELRRCLLSGLLSGLRSGLIFAVPIEFVARPALMRGSLPPVHVHGWLAIRELLAEPALALGLTLGAASGLVSGLLNFLSQPDHTERSTSVMRSFTGNRTQTALHNLLSRLLAGPMKGLLLGPVSLYTAWLCVILALHFLSLPLSWLLPDGLTSWLPDGLSIRLMSWLTSWLTSRLTDGLTGRLAGGLASWLTDGVTDRLASWPTDRPASWLVSWLVFGLVSWLVFGLVGGLVFGLVFGLMDELTDGLTGPNWANFQRAAWWSYTRGHLPAPWRVMPTLLDCHRLGLLREVGPVWQFRHAALQDHLAPPAPEHALRVRLLEMLIKRRIHLEHNDVRQTTPIRSTAEPGWW